VKKISNAINEVTESIIALFILIVVLWIVTMFVSTMS
jgi:hypothetical protein